MTTSPITPSGKGMTLRLDQIEIPERARPYSATTVVELARSIREIGLQSAPTVIERDGRFVLVAGRHRIEALKLLHVESVLVRVVDFDDIEARMWTIAENCFRAELTVAQRAQQVAEYVELARQKREAPPDHSPDGQTAQLAHPVLSDGRRAGPQHLASGDSLAAHDLGISRDEVRRAKIIATLPEETKQAAREAGLDDNQSALLKAAKAPTPEAQIAVLCDVRDRGRVADDQPRPPESDDLDPIEEPTKPAPAKVVDFKERPNTVSAMDAKPLRNLVNILAGEFALWIKITTPRDRPHVISVIEMAASILRDELNGKGAV